MRVNALLSESEPVQDMQKHTIVLTHSSAHFVDQYGQWRHLEEDVRLCFVGGLCRKALAYHAVPVWPILAVEPLLDVPRNVLLVLVLAHRQGRLAPGISAHLRVLIGVRGFLVLLWHFL